MRLANPKSITISVEGQEQRRQDGNFNGGVLAYYEHVNAVGDNLEDNFDFS